MNYLRTTILLLVLAIIMPFVTAEEIVSVARLGYHPAGQAEVIIYTHNTTATAQLLNAQNITIANITLQRPKDNAGQNTSCQGNLTCWVGTIPTTTNGVYRIKYGNTTSAPFQINASIYQQTIPIYLEYLNAHMMQNSSYHANFFGSETPKFTIMADGAFLMHADQAAIALGRLGNAYRANPTIFQQDKYTVRQKNTSDMQEYMLAYTQYLVSLQANNQQSNPYLVPTGWGTEWGAWRTQNANTTYFTTSKPSWLNFDATIQPQYTAKTAFAYASALQALSDYNRTYATQILNRSILTTKAAQNMSGLEADDKAYIGSALFLLYDHTGNWTYVQQAYNLRASVEQTLVSDHTRGNEFYWEQYVAHRSTIEALGLPYNINGMDPATIMTGKVLYDYKDRGELSMSRNGERVFQFDPNIQFFNSRYQLIEAAYALKANAAQQSPIFSEVAQAQLAWLTGKNAVQHGSYNNDLRSVSFISGIGTQLLQYHSRMMPIDKQGTWKWNTGTYDIPGWISGAYDTTSDNDVIYNYQEAGAPYYFTESTNEIVTLAIEDTALLDKLLNNKTSAIPLILLNQTTAFPNVTLPNSTGNTTNSTNSTNACVTLATAPATCTGGNITADQAGGCRTIVCENGTTRLAVLACDKGNSFEMYKQLQTGNGLTICLGATCISNNGFAKYDYCAAPAPGPQQNATLNITTVIINDNNGTLNTSAFTVLLSGQQANSSQVLVPGQYTISSDAVAGYSIAVSGDCAASGAITLAAGANKTCTITFNDVPQGGSCAEHIEQLPVSCDGTLTSDITSGACRTLICESASGSTKVLACDKPGSYQPTHFEMYKQEQTGAGATVCLGLTCIKDNGFAKGSNYPACEGGIAPPPANGTLSVTSLPAANISINGNLFGVSPLSVSLAPGSYQIVAAAPGYVSQTTQITVTSSSTATADFTLELQGDLACHASMQTVPATCTGGTITTDERGGCRTIICSNEGDSLKTLVCDKGAFFEMYKQEQIGSSVSKICLGATCISDNGYAKSENYPICI